MQITPTLLTVTYTERSVLSRIASHFPTWTSGVVLLWSWLYFVMVSASKSVFITASWSKRRLYTDTILTQQDWIGWFYVLLKFHHWPVYQYTMFQQVIASQACPQPLRGRALVNDQLQEHHHLVYDMVRSSGGWSERLMGYVVVTSLYFEWDGWCVDLIRPELVLKTVTDNGKIIWRDSKLHVNIIPLPFK